MTAAGQAAVDDAKASGAWLAIESAQAGEAPDDLRAALDRDADARRHWDNFPPSTERAILEWIGSRHEARQQVITLSGSCPLARIHRAPRVGGAIE
jgi:uncharacterized protein YdeI (YjbR/CyaY-like superfamily)